MQPRQGKRVAATFEQRSNIGLVAFRMALENLGGGNRHRRIEKDLHRRIKAIALDALAKEEQNFLCPLKREGRDNDVAAARKRILDRLIEFLHRCLERSVQAVAIGRFHHHDFRFRRGDRRTQERPSGIAEIPGIKDAAPFTTLSCLEQNAGGAENVTGIEEGGAKARLQFQATAVFRNAAEPVETVERVEHRVERRRLFVSPASRRSTRAMASLFLLKVG